MANRVILVGFVGKDPEVRKLGDINVAHLSLATSETFTRNEEKVTQTEWHNIVAWRGLAKVAENYIKKGTQLYIEGALRTRSWEDSDGNKRYTTEIVAQNIQMLGRKSDNQQSQEVENINEEADDLPF